MNQTVAENPKRTTVEACLEALAAFRAQPPAVTSAAELTAAEATCAQLCDALYAALLAERTQAALDRPELRDQARDLARSAPRRLKRAGERQVSIQFRRGTPVSLRAEYYRRAHGPRRRREKGLYPALTLLGIHDHTSPGAAALLAASTCALASLREAATLLRTACNLAVDVKTLRRVACHFAQRARQALSRQPTNLALGEPGRTLVVSVDGGRLRIRRHQQGRRTPKGASRYHTDWREPLLLHLYVVDEKGRLDRNFTPLIDGTLGGADALFAQLQTYQPLLTALAPARVLLIADGASWIWTRFAALLKKGVFANAHLVVQLVDFYHAVEHLGVFAEACTHWPRARRAAWRTQARKLLRTGQSERLLADMDRLCERHPRAKTLRREFNYFWRHRHHLKYAWARHLRLPIGSGPMESAIRRVVNLRLKGPGIFWLEPTAEALLLLRAFYKAGRWHELSALASLVPAEAL